MKVLRERPPFPYREVSLVVLGMVLALTVPFPFMLAWQSLGSLGFGAAWLGVAAVVSLIAFMRRTR